MALQGFVDSAQPTRVEGWAFDPENPNAAVDVEVWLGTDRLARGTADKYRADLEQAGKGSGLHGFDIALDQAVEPARLSVRFATGGQPLANSPADRVTPARRMQYPRAENPLLEDLLAEDGITGEAAETVRTFARDGFLRLRIADPDFDRLADEAIRQVDWSRSNGIRLQDAWQDVEAVRRLAALPEVLDLLELLYGRAPIPFQTLNFRVGTQQETHTDSIHFNSRPQRFMCGVWIALEPIDEHNGALHYYPGSHRLPVLDVNDIGLIADEGSIDANYATYVEMLQALIRTHGLTKRVAVVDRGEAIVWAANLYHGGEPILDPGRTRYSQVTHYYFEGCAYYAPLVSNPYLNQIVRPDRKDVRTGLQIPHQFGDRFVEAPPPSPPPTEMPEAPAARPSLWRRLVGG